MTTKKHLETVAVLPDLDDDTESTALVEAENREVSLSRALHVNTRFVSCARRGSDEDSAPRRLGWRTGNNEAWSINGKTALPSARGWILDQPDEDAGLLPDDYKLMDAMETLCEQRRAAECLIAYENENGGKPRRVASWVLPVASLFVVCEGVPSKREMLSDPACRWGVAYAWPEGQGSELHLVAFIKELMEAGYNGVFAVKFSGVVTDKALACLKAQEYVLDFADELRDRAGDDQPASYYAYALPMRCSDVTMTAGRPPKKTTEVYYPVPVIPRLSHRDVEAAIAHLDRIAITVEQAAVIEDGDRIASTVAWSVKKSQRLISGDTSDETPGSYTGIDIDGNEVIMEIPEGLR